MTYGFRFGEDRFVSDPLDDALVPETAHIWKDLLALASVGHPLAQKIRKLGRAMNEKKLAASERRPMEAWALATLRPILDEYQTENLGDARAALSRALA